jgi:hypothetical protein
MMICQILKTHFDLCKKSGFFMKVIFTLLSLAISSGLAAQNFDGQWRGSFTETSYSFAGFGGNKIDYVLELQISGSDVSGYSYTYFYEGSKKYYTICKLTGTLNKATKEIVVTETERVKYNTPPDFQNCFQTHRLQYVRDSGDIETLRGTWIPAPNQSGDCGYGTTFLSRKIVKQVALGDKPVEKKMLPKKVTKPIRKPVIRSHPSTNTAIAKKTYKPKTTPLRVKPKEQTKATPPPGPSLVITKEKAPSNIPPPAVSKERESEPSTAAAGNFEERRKDIVKTISITQPTFRVDFYDNGIIDGDSITVFYNGKVILLHKMLSDKAITLNLSLDKSRKENVLTMYADNLGSIPPNTALMIVNDGDKRYEVNIDSDTQKSGSVVFVSGNK